MMVINLFICIFLSELVFAAQHKNTRKKHEVQRESAKTYLLSHIYDITKIMKTTEVNSDFRLMGESFQRGLKTEEKIA